jgi:CheY-like chemotaxis protein
MMDLNYLNDKTILVVDDDKFNIQLIETMLKKIANDVQVVSTDKGSEVLSTLEIWDGRIDMVLLDLQMPEMSGEEILQNIREELKLDVPVVIISVNGLDEKALLEMGANDFVLKPFDLDDLKATILKHLPKKRND